MSGIAEFYIIYHSISGSDLNENENVEITKIGIKIYIGHNQKMLADLMQ